LPPLLLHLAPFVSHLFGGGRVRGICLERAGLQQVGLLVYHSFCQSPWMPLLLLPPRIIHTPEYEKGTRNH